VFESARSVDTVLFDKTGTVTEGAMSLAEVVPSPGHAPDEVLALAAAVESGSEHPIARAVVEGARDRGAVVPPATDLRIEPGAGASARVAGHDVRVGRPERPATRLTGDADRMAGHGLTVFTVDVDGEAVGLIGVSDRVKPEVAATVGRLAGMGMDVAMVTGDRRAAAAAIAGTAGIDRVLAEVYPRGKVDEVKRLQLEDHRVVFVGDGINDAPALAQADVGIALGSGTDVAIEAADVTLLGGRIEAVADALELARRTYRVIAENLFWAFAYNVVMIPLAVLGFLTPMWASGAMAASSVSVVLNALRLRRFRRSSRRLVIG